MYILHLSHINRPAQLVERWNDWYLDTSIHIVRFININDFLLPLPAVVHHVAIHLEVVFGGSDAVSAAGWPSEAS
jgi:hypothetical protein